MEQAEAGWLGAYGCLFCCGFSIRNSHECGSRTCLHEMKHMIIGRGEESVLLKRSEYSHGPREKTCGCMRMSWCSLVGAMGSGFQEATD